MATAGTGIVDAVMGMLRVVDIADGAFTARFLFHKIVFFCYTAVNAYAVFNGGIPTKMRAFTVAASEDAILETGMGKDKITTPTFMMTIIIII